MSTILITGTNGLIGAELVDSLKDLHTVYALARTAPVISNNINFIPIDLSTEIDLKDLPKKADVIIHLAQSEHFREFPEKALDVFNVNTASTVRLLDYGVKAGVKKFIYASSGGIYGFGNQGFSEEHEIVAHGDLGFYLGTKLCSEILLESYAACFDIDIVRFFFAYGPRQRKNMLIPRLINSVIEGKPIVLQGKNGLRLNPIYVSDAVSALIKCLDLKGSQKINIGGNEVLSLREICNIIGESVGKEPTFEINMNVEPKHIYGNISLMRKLLGEPLVSLKDGIKKML